MYSVTSINDKKICSYSLIDGFIFCKKVHKFPGIFNEQNLVYFQIYKIFKIRAKDHKVLIVLQEDFIFHKKLYFPAIIVLYL
jgi:hypothetical protein